MTHFKRISVSEADNILAITAEALLLDVRHERDFTCAHHPKATLLTDGVLKHIIRTKSKSTPIVIYCYHGNSSQDIARMFAEFGFKACYSVDGGYDAWRNPLEDRFAISNKLEDWIAKKGYSGHINARVDSENRTPLMIAAKNGRADIVQELVDAGADPNLTDINGNNALWFACMAQNVPCIHKLINADVDVDNQNIFGFTALNYAIGHDDISNILTNYFDESASFYSTSRYEHSFINVNEPANHTPLRIH